MNGNQIKTRLHSGKRVYGTLILSPSPQWTAMVDQMGIDFVFIDTEHIALDRLTLAWMCHAYSARGQAPFVRIPSPDPHVARMALDGGASGLIAPYVESVSQVRDLVGAVKYKPLKGGRLEQALENPRCLEPELRDYLSQVNSDNVLVVNIESTPAIDNLDRILDVDGLDAVLVGPHDLTCSLGIPEQYEHPRFVEAVDGILKKTVARSVGVGIHSISPSLSRQELRWARMGANLIVHSADRIAASEKLGEEIRKIRKELGDGIGPSRRQEVDL